MRQLVESNNIRSIGYDPSTATLEVEFHKGLYKYYGVPEIEYKKLMLSESKGHYFAGHIKGHYPYKKV